MKVTAVERIAHRDLRNNGSSILRRVAAGESFKITNHGEVIAVLSPHSRRVGGLAVAKEATRRGGWSKLAKRALSRPTGEILDELREERL
ncbi:MAG: type II toxin-antitoxin system prevent-host-death family antitoxin [Nocardioides sp.]|nr:type II toxin-antitoxin system prevent-host-death family antitoxin [Nocardioides sp.]